MNNDDIKKKSLWVILFIIVAILSIWLVIKQSDLFSFKLFITYLSDLSLFWVILAILSMLAYILMEGLAIKLICKSLGHKISIKNSFFYSASDIYFSAITPSATGGAPACAYFMAKDKIPGSTITISLLLNLMTYTLSLVIIGLISILIFPKIFISFNLLFKVLLIIGFIIHFMIVIFIYLLIYKDNFLQNILLKIVGFLSKIHLIKNVEAKNEKIIKYITNYQNETKIIKEKRKILLKNFFYNFLQRISQIAVFIFIYLAMHGSIRNIGYVGAIQSFVYLGAYMIPIPGAMGITDYLMIQGFGYILNPNLVSNFELISRGISFYLCILICGISTLIKFLRKESAVK